MLRYKFTPTITSEFKQISPDNDGHVLLPPCVACQLPVQLAHHTSSLDTPSNCRVGYQMFSAVCCWILISKPNLAAHNL